MRTGGLTYERVNELLKRIKYKPGWIFHALPSNDRHHVVIHFQLWAQNSYGPGHFDVREDQHYDFGPRYSEFGKGMGEPMETMRYSGMYKHTVLQEVIKITGQYALPFVVDEERFFMWFREHLIRFMEEHESDEWFRVDGKIVKDPHKLPAAADR